MKVKPREVILKNRKLVTLRSATSGDAENLLHHLTVTHTESYKNLNQTAAFWKNFSISDEEKILMEFETSKNKFMLVAEFDGRIVGGLGFVGHQAEFLRRTANIGMSIQKEFCNSGLGTAMMSYMLELGREFGFHRVELTVRTYNLPGIKLYEKSGFRRVGLLKDTALIDGQYVDEFSYQIILGE
jgi:RimJ/RimL family protein N-acetyltransferase